MVLTDKETGKEISISAKRISLFEASDALMLDNFVFSRSQNTDDTIFILNFLRNIDNDKTIFFVKTEDNQYVDILDKNMQKVYNLFNEDVFIDNIFRNIFADVIMEHAYSNRITIIQAVVKGEKTTVDLLNYGTNKIESHNVMATSEFVVSLSPQKLLQYLLA